VITKLKEAWNYKKPFGVNLQSKLMEVLSRFNCREVPNSNIREVLVSVARYEFITKPFAAVTMINTGIPLLHTSFWSQKSVEKVVLEINCYTS
jgi:hypothetical protein